MSQVNRNNDLCSSIQKSQNEAILKMQEDIRTMQNEVLNLFHGLDHTLDQFLTIYKQLRQKKDPRAAKLNESARLILELTSLHGLWYSSLSPWLQGSISSTYAKWPSDPKQEWASLQNPSTTNFEGLYFDLQQFQKLIAQKLELVLGDTLTQILTDNGTYKFSKLVLVETAKNRKDPDMMRCPWNDTQYTGLKTDLLIKTLLQMVSQQERDHSLQKAARNVQMEFFDQDASENGKIVPLSLSMIESPLATVKITEEPLQRRTDLVYGSLDVTVPSTTVIKQSGPSFLEKAKSFLKGLKEAGSKKYQTSDYQKGPTGSATGSSPISAPSTSYSSQIGSSLRSFGSAASKKLSSAYSSLKQKFSKPSSSTSTSNTSNTSKTNASNTSTTNVATKSAPQSTTTIYHYQDSSKGQRPITVPNARVTNVKFVRKRSK